MKKNRENRTMRIVFWGQGNRGVACFNALRSKGYVFERVIVYPSGSAHGQNPVMELAREQGIKTVAPEDPNGEEMEQLLRGDEADLFILAGYGKIIRHNILEIPRLMSVNLHAGKLPEYRGSSPLNWSLIKGEKSFTLSIIRVNEKVDGGDILLERTFPISITDTIRDLHQIANEEFPRMLLETLRQIETGTYALKPQDTTKASYYPLRFPEDGFILWDLYTAEQIHNRIRALTEPYPCAFTFFNGKKVKLLLSELNESDFFGEPGRVYRITDRGLLVCASDKCLWIKQAVFDDSGEPLSTGVKRYEKLATLKGQALLNQSFSFPK